jgi:hypothetical protein
VCIWTVVFCLQHFVISYLNILYLLLNLFLGIWCFVWCCCKGYCGFTLFPLYVNSIWKYSGCFYIDFISIDLDKFSYSSFSILLDFLCKTSFTSLLILYLYFFLISLYWLRLIVLNRLKADILDFKESVQYISLLQSFYIRLWEFLFIFNLLKVFIMNKVKFCQMLFFFLHLLWCSPVSSLFRWCGELQWLLKKMFDQLCIPVIIT